MTIPTNDDAQRQPAASAARGRPLRFLIAGAFNTGFGLAIFPLLLWSNNWLAKHYMVALVIAQALSVLFAFTTFKVGVFRAEGNVGRQFGVFSIFYLFIFAANWVALPLLVEFGNFTPMVAQVGFALLVMGVSYFWHSRITFRHRGSIS